MKLMKGTLINENTIHLKDKINLKKGSEVFLKISTIEEEKEEFEQWSRGSIFYLAKLYDEDEPEYSVDKIKEKNPGYKS